MNKTNPDGSWTDDNGHNWPLIVWNVREDGRADLTSVVAHCINFCGDWVIFYTAGLIVDSFYKPGRITPERNTGMGSA